MILLGTELAQLPIEPSTQEIVAWHPASGSDPRIQIWDVESKLKLAALEGHAQKVTGLSFHPEGGLLASGSWDGMVHVWDWPEFPEAIAGTTQPQAGRPAVGVASMAGR
jgi:WD40 repeat protein